MTNNQPISFNQKLSLKEVAENLSIHEYILEFWVREFSKFGFNNSKEFSEKEFKLALLIKRLLYEECFTIKGVKRRLEGYNFENIKDTTKIETEKNHSDSIKSKNSLFIQFSLDCNKNMDIISSEVQSILELTSID